MTINYSKQVLVKRGNTAVSSTYTGPLGEITLDTDLHQLRLHDGETAGGWLVPSGQDFANLETLINSIEGFDANLLSNASTQQSQIDSLVANVNILFANAAIQSISLDNLVNEGNVDPGTDNETFWFNTEDGRLYIKYADTWIDSNPTELPSPSYITGIMGDFAGNIVPAANVTYSLGTQEAQWKDLWVSNNTIYIGNTPITVSNGTLLVDGNAVSGGGNLGKFVFGSDGDSAFLHTTDDAGDLDGYNIVLIPGGEGESSITIPKQANALAGDPLVISATAANSSVAIETSSGTFSFSNLGLTFPQGSIFGTGNDDGEFVLDTWGNKPFSIYTYGGPDTHRWKFGTDGNLTLPTGGNILNSDNSVYGGGGTPAGNTGEIQVNVDGAFGSYDTLTYVDNEGEMTLGADYVNTGGLFVSDIYSRDIASNVNITSVYGTNWKFGSDGNLILPGKLWARTSDNGSISFTNDGTTERGYLKVDAGYNMTVNAESNYYVKRNGTDRLAIESNYTTIRSGTATRIETNLVGISRTYTFGETGVLGLPYESYLESTPARNLNLGAWGNISIIADAQSNSTTSWIFGADGDLILPGNIKGATGTGPVTVTSNDGATDYIWTFGTDGKLTSPGKIQTTDTTNSISTTTGALIVGGGAGIHSDVHIGGTLNITDTTPSTDYTTGALVVAGGMGVNGNINLTGNINILNGNINIQEFTGSTGNFYGDVVTGFNAFYAGKTGFTALPYTVAQFSTASNTYSQINMENTSTGKLASADFVGTADIGTDASWFFDIGIANSGYDPVLGSENNAPGTAIGPLDAYYYVQGNVDVPATGGNLAIGTSQIGKVVKFIAGGVNAANVIMTVTETGVIVAQNLTAPNMAYAADVAAANAAIVTANSTMLANVNAANAAIITANTAMKSYVDSRPAGSTYSNTNVTAYIAGSITTGNISIASNFGNIVFNNGSYISGNVAGREGSILLSPAASGTFPGVMIGGSGRLLAPNGSVHQIFNASDVTFQVAAKVIAGTVSTSTTTGALIITGGIGVSGNVNTGGNIATAGQISATGNVRTSGKFVGDGSLLTNVTVNAAGNIQGTGTNINLVAGSYTATFDNTGLFTLPAMGGDEGGEINLGIPTTNTTLQNRVAIDVFQNRIRFFEGSVDAKGAYLDLSQAAAGVGTLLNNRVSGFVNAGTFVTMDLIKATVTTSGQRGLSLATTTGTFAYNIGGTYGTAIPSSGGSSVAGTLSTTATASMFNWNFGSAGDTSTYILTDTTNSRAYRITLQIGSSYNNNMISIERLI